MIWNEKSWTRCGGQWISWFQPPKECTSSSTPTEAVKGGLGGRLQTGRSLDYLDAGDGNRKLCSLYLGLMDRMGVKLDHFGDADTRLEKL